jgi:outer membrane protein OmpA-like peptidoglycan-associated protein
VFKIIRALLVIYLVYLCLALLVVLPALNILPQWFVKKETGRELRSEIILFNPFTLSLDIRKAAIPEHNGERFVDLDKASINLSLSSLWRPGIVFDKLLVKNLFVHIRQLPGDQFNFSDMLPPEQEDAAETPTTIPGITIDDLDFHASRLQLTNETREEPFSNVFDNLAVKVKGLSTVLLEGKPYSIDAEGEAGGKLHWEGEVSIPNSSGSGSLQLSNISLPSFWKLIEPWVNFELVEGRLDAGGDYELDWQERFTYQVSNASTGLKGIKIAPKKVEELPDTGIELQELQIAGITIDGAQQHADVTSVTVAGLDIAGWSEGEQVSLQQLFAPVSQDSGGTNGTAAESETPPASTGASEKAEDAPAWTAAIHTVSLQQNKVAWRSEFTDPPLLEISPLDAQISNLNWPLSGDSPLGLTLVINNQAKMALEGSLALDSGTGTIGYKLDALPLGWFTPNFPSELKARITSGELQITGEVVLAEFMPGEIRLDGAITDFSGALLDTEESLTAWETIRWTQLVVNMDKRSVALEKLSIDNYSGRLHIRKDGTINAQNVWAEEIDKHGEQVAEVTQELDEAPWNVNLRNIKITDSALDFMDESLPIRFRTIIGDLNGEILNISSDEGAEAKVEITGSVDGYAPVKLGGTTAPFASPPKLDLGLSFEGVDMALLSPYSSTYAGYAIERGLLNLDLKYALANGQLQGNNKVLVDQLKLGDKVDSDQAVDIPLKLALALLTDMNGVIDMEVPVSGSMEDPSFSIGSVVADAFLNLITKAVTAPFSLLAGLVNTDEDLQRLNFPSGSSQLSEAANDKLSKLAEAMAQRPELDLVIIGRLRVSSDRERMQKNALKAEMITAGLSPEQWDSKGPDWEAAIAERYRDQGQTAGSELTVREQYLALAKAIEIPDSALLALSEDRAVAVKTFLVNQAKLGSERAAIEQNHLEDEGNRFSGVELGVDI